MTFHRFSVLIGILLVGLASLQAQVQPAANVTSSPASAQRAVLNRYCVSCHNERLKTAGLMLDKADIDKVAENGELWEKVIRKLRTSAMPPPGLPRPDQATSNSVASYLETSLDRAAAAKPNPAAQASTA